MGSEYQDINPELKEKAFAGVLYHSADPWPERTRFSDTADYEAWLARVLSATTMPAQPAPAADTRLLVCCTCAYNHSAYNYYAALAAIEEEQEHRL